MYHTIMDEMTKPPSNDKPRIVLVDDEHVVRSGLELALTALGFDVCATADNAVSALQVVDEVKPDAVVTDLAMPGPNGIQLTARLRAKYPQMPVGVLSSHDESLFASQAVAAGASGYIMKNAELDVLEQAIRHILSGGMYLSPAMWERLTVPSTPVAMDATETRVFERLGINNPSTALIARDLDLPIREVESLVHQLVFKTGAGTVVSLRVLAAEQRRPVTS